jgi:hypothetical protein
MIKVTAAESSKRSTGKTCELKMSIKSKKKCKILSQRLPEKSRSGFETY